MPRQASIRNQLETQTRRSHPELYLRRHRGRKPARRRKTLAWQDRTLLILASALLLLLLLRIETARANGPDDPFWGLEFQDAHGAQRAVALDTDIDVEVTGLAARIYVTQEFRNTGVAWAEATYRFPLPDGAAVDRLQVAVGERLLEGEIREKQEALRQYRQARSDGKVASLVEQERANQFQTRLANVGPGENIRITIGFLARVGYRDGSYSLRIPLTFTPRWDGEAATAGEAALTGPGHAAAPLIAPPGELDDHRLVMEIDLRSGLELASIVSRYHDVDIHPTLGGYRVHLADPDTRSDREFVLEWAPELGSSPVATLSTHDGGDAVYAMLMLAPPLAEAVAPQPREVVFIIDTSGSMEGTSLTQARAALKLGLTYLEPDDRFNLIRFSSRSEALFHESVPAYPAYLQEASDFLDDLSANGGTVMAPALAMAMDLPEQPGLLRQIVFVTDGSVGNEQELLLQIAEHLGDSRLFTVSIGSAPNAWFMRKAAEIGRGNHTRIGRLEEVRERISGLWSRIENPAIQNVCIDWGMDSEYYPEIVPDLYAGEPLWLYARLPREPDHVSVCGELAGRYWEMNTRLLPVPGGESLATLWAGSKIEALEDSRIFGEDPERIRREVSDLGLAFGLLTRYTSLIAVDRTPSRPGTEILEAEEIPSLLPAGSGIGSGFSRTATGWPARLALSLISLLVVTGMLIHATPSRKRMPVDARSPMSSSPS